MANHKSTIKRMKQNPRRRLRNMHVKSTVKTATDKVNAAAAANDVEAAGKLLVEASSILDRAASKGVIHKNKASRKKSRLARRVKLLTASKGS